MNKRIYMIILAGIIFTCTASMNLERNQFITGKYSLKENKLVCVGRGISTD
jgi:hypothetical protein